MISQLIYVSTRTKQCSDQEIPKILESSNKNNGKDDITGVLLYSDKKFLQVLEGETKAITELYDHIQKDTRHKNVMMISLAPIKERSFPSWQMGSREVAKDFSFLSNMNEQEQKEFNKILNGEENNKAIKLINKLFEGDKAKN